MKNSINQLKKLKENKEIVNELIEKHQANTCSCKYSTLEDSHFCPVWLYLDGCSLKDFENMVENIAEQRKEEYGF